MFDRDHKLPSSARIAQTRSSRRPSATALIAVVAAAFPIQPVLAQATDLRALEKSFDAQVSSADQIAWLKDFSSAPNHVGAPHNRENADKTLAMFKQWGWDAKIETFDVLFPTPISTTLELVAPDKIALGGQEPAVAQDDTSQKLDGALPPYVAYQGDGDVTAPVVYLNYGMPDDYDALERRGISVKGKIVLTRYGGGWRGLKPKLAQEHGAVGALIYSDPADDGYGRNDSYPKGGGRPEGGVQRGSVADITTYPGDPLTPGIGATKDAKRLTRTTAKTILKIPTLPISYGDATKILSRLDGPVVTGRARGDLPLAYHWGGSDSVKLHLAVKSDWSLQTIYNVIATLKGTTRPNEWIVRGNHRDGWVFGAADPLSGHGAMLSEAKALGALVRSGWKPQRTIVYASWDGEEPGLLGSTEWGEEHAAELTQKAVIYLNTDGNGRGFFGAEGSHNFQHFVNMATRDVLDPQTGVTAYERARANVRTGAYLGTGRDNPPYAVDAAKVGGDLPIGPLGSGSDYAVFIEHLGIPSLNLGFGGEGAGDGSYHSVYDSFYHYTHFDDPGLVYGAALSKVVGRLVIRAADAPRTPTRFSDFSTTVGRYVSEVKKLAADQRERDRALKDLSADDAFRLTSFAEDPTAKPKDDGITPVFDMLALEDASDRLNKAARAADAAVETSPTLPAEVRARIETAVKGIDLVLADKDGLPGRPWYRNLIYAPGTLTGYGAKTLPGVREGIEQRRFDDAKAYIGKTAAVLDAYAARLETAAAVVASYRKP